MVMTRKQFQLYGIFDFPLYKQPFRHIYRRAVNVVRNTFSAVTLADLIQELYGMIRSKQEAR